MEYCTCSLRQAKLPTFKVHFSCDLGFLRHPRNALLLHFWRRLIMAPWPRLKRPNASPQGTDLPSQTESQTPSKSHARRCLSTRAVEASSPPVTLHFGQHGRLGRSWCTTQGLFASRPKADEQFAILRFQACGSLGVLGGRRGLHRSATPCLSQEASRRRREGRDEAFASLIALSIIIIIHMKGLTNTTNSGIVLLYWLMRQ